MNSYKKMPPMEIVSRFLMMEQLREMGADLVRTYNPNLVQEYEEEDDDGIAQTVYEFDYDYIIFTAPIFQLEMVFKKLEEEGKIEKPKKSTIIMPS